MPEIGKSKKLRRGIFISYARSDGKNFADDLRRRLVDEYHFQVWQDIVELEGGKDWWLQIEAAIKSVEFLVMVMTPGALASDTTRKEWRLARQEAVCVLPVIAAAIDFSSLPRWMSKKHFFDFKFSEQWARFIRTLQTPYKEERVPFMVEDLPEDFVPRSYEYEQLLNYLLDKDREEPLAITAALRGAGGYGKTTLAKALCHDECIQEAFDDGILWVTLGESPGDLTSKVNNLIEILTGERPGFSDVPSAQAKLVELLADRDILLVIDDVWSNAHLMPFLQGGKRCSRLITTRNSITLPTKARGIDLDAMRADEATRLLRFYLPEGEWLGLQRLAQRLGEWPLLLKLANATLRDRVHNKRQSLAVAIAYVNRALDKYGLTAFDARHAIDRSQAVAKTLGLSLELLNAEEHERYLELAIFPEDVDIPLATLEKLWSQAGYDDFMIEEFCDRLHRLSLLLRFDLSDRTIRLHDVVRKYLIEQQPEKLANLHTCFLQAYQIHDWTNLPADEPYLWRHLVYHLRESSQTETLRHLLFDYDWLASKLAVYDINALLADYDFFPEDRELRLVQSALRLSVNLLARDHQQLPSHLLGRLIGQESPGIQSFLEHVAKKAKKTWLRPLTLSLTPAGGPLLRTLEGHIDYVNAVALTPDGKYAVSASEDKTLKVWDLASGQALRTLKGHNDYVTSVAITPDGKTVVSGSSDNTLKVWDLASGQVRLTLEGHRDQVNSVAITPNGKYAVSASSDNTLIVWDLTSGQALRTLKGHSDYVASVAITLDGKYAVSGSEDKTLKVWDLASDQALWTLEGHSKSVTSVALTPDRKYAVSASSGTILKVWDFLFGHRKDLPTGQASQTLEGHSKSVTNVALTLDSKYAVSSSRDKTLKVWDLASSQVLQTLEGHSKSVTSVALTFDGKYAVSASWDKTLKVWNLASDQVLRTSEGHRDSVSSVALTPDGKHAVSASFDHTLKVWDLASGRLLQTLEEHTGSVYSVALMPDGKYAVSASADGTLKVWDLASGQALRTLKWHSVNSVAITPDGNYAVSASWDTLKVLDLASGQVLQTLKGHRERINSVALTPNGQLAVSASFDLKVWDLASGQVAANLRRA